MNKVVMGKDIVFDFRHLASRAVLNNPVKKLLQIADTGTSRMQQSGRYLLLVIAATVVLTGCNTLTAPGESEPVAEPVAAELSGEKPVDQQPVTVSAADDSDITETAGKELVSLDGDTLFNLLAAEFAGNAGDVEASLSYYREASKTIEDSRIAARSAYIAIYGGDYEEALKALDRWQELEPDADELPKMYALTYLHLHQPEKAAAYIGPLLIDSHESSSDEAMAVKQLLATDASTEDAYIVLQKLNEREDKNKHLLVLQSRYAAELKRYDEALSLLDEVLVIDPSLSEVLIIKARILSTQGKYEEATLMIKQVVDEYPDNDPLRLQYARMLVEQRKLEQATEQYQILYEHLPDEEDIAFSLSLLYIETKKLDEATEVLEHLVEIDKQTYMANYYLGRIAQSRGEDKLAVSYFLHVSGGEYAYDAQLRIGILLAMLGKPDEGLAKLEALAEAQDNWSLRVKAYLAQGEILRSEQLYKEGVEMYSRALQQNREDTSLLYARGLMAEKVDRLDITEADLLKVINKEPQNANALNALGYTLADRTVRYEEALDYIKRAAELVPDDPAILDSLGWVSFRLGKMDEAIEWLSKAFAKLEDAEIAAHYGEVLWTIDQKDKAREVWEKGKADNAENPVLLETLERLNPDQKY